MRRAELFAWQVMTLSWVIAGLLAGAILQGCAL